MTDAIKTPLEAWLEKQVEKMQTSEEHRAMLRKHGVNRNVTQSCKGCINLVKHSEIIQNEQLKRLETQVHHTCQASGSEAHWQTSWPACRRHGLWIPKKKGGKK